MCSDVVFFMKLNSTNEVKFKTNRLRSPQRSSQLKKTQRITVRGLKSNMKFETNIS